MAADRVYTGIRMAHSSSLDHEELRAECQVSRTPCVHPYPAVLPRPLAPLAFYSPVEFVLCLLKGAFIRVL